MLPVSQWWPDSQPKLLRPGLGPPGRSPARGRASVPLAAGLPTGRWRTFSVARDEVAQVRRSEPQRAT